MVVKGVGVVVVAASRGVDEWWINGREIPTYKSKNNQFLKFLFLVIKYEQ